MGPSGRFRVGRLAKRVCSLLAISAKTPFTAGIWLGASRSPAVTGELGAHLAQPAKGGQSPKIVSQTTGSSG
jgi:hypothetical protein